MNVGELGFWHREKVQGEAILAHVPVYVMGNDKNGDAWYFTSEKFITLRKKKENTSYSKFIRATQQRNENQANSNSVGDTNTVNNKTNIPASSQYQSLVYVLKQSLNYSQSKIKHALVDHMIHSQSNLHIQGVKCAICEQIEKNDYDFVLMKRDRLVSELKQVQNENDGMTSKVLDKVMKKILLGDKNIGSKNTQIQENSVKMDFNNEDNRISSTLSIPTSSFNLFHHQTGFKYSTCRIELLQYKTNHLKLNQNRINYKRQLHSNESDKLSKGQFFDFDETVNNKNDKEQISEKISSVIWTREFLVFDADKQTVNNNHNNKSNSKQRICTSHMKQKLSQKCQLLVKNLQSYYHQLIKTESSKIDFPSQEFTVSVRQFRLWYLNNTIKNNHLYTICVSDIRLAIQMRDKEALVELYKRVNLGRVLQPQSRTDRSKDQGCDLTQGIMHIRQRITSSVRKMKSKPHSTQKIRIQGYNLPNNDENKKSEVRQQQIQPYQNLSIHCECCLSPAEKQIKSQQRVIIKRHLQNLREKVNDRLKEDIQKMEYKLLALGIEEGKQHKVGEQREIRIIQEQNQLIHKLQATKQTNQRVRLTLQNLKQSNGYQQDQYKESNVCQYCYQVFLDRLINIPSNQISNPNGKSFPNFSQPISKIKNKSISSSKPMKNNRNLTTTLASNLSSNELNQSNFQLKHNTINYMKKPHNRPQSCSNNSQRHRSFIIGKNNTNTLIESIESKRERRLVSGRQIHWEKDLVSIQQYRKKDKHPQKCKWLQLNEKTDTNEDKSKYILSKPVSEESKIHSIEINLNKQLNDLNLDKVQIPKKTKKTRLQRFEEEIDQQN